MRLNIVPKICEFMAKSYGPIWREKRKKPRNYKTTIKKNVYYFALRVIKPLAALKMVII